LIVPSRRALRNLGPWTRLPRIKQTKRLPSAATQQPGTFRTLPARTSPSPGLWMAPAASFGLQSRPLGVGVVRGSAISCRPVAKAALRRSRGVRWCASSAQSLVAGQFWDTCWLAIEQSRRANQQSSFARPARPRSSPARCPSCAKRTLLISWPCCGVTGGPLLPFRLALAAFARRLSFSLLCLASLSVQDHVRVCLLASG
jgi:hypothetical protein